MRHTRNVSLLGGARTGALYVYVVYVCAPCVLCGTRLLRTEAAAAGRPHAGRRWSGADATRPRLPTPPGGAPPAAAVRRGPRVVAVPRPSRPFFRAAEGAPRPAGRPKGRAAAEKLVWEVFDLFSVFVFFSFFFFFVGGFNVNTSVRGMIVMVKFVRVCTSCRINICRRILVCSMEIAYLYCLINFFNELTLNNYYYKIIFVIMSIFFNFKNFSLIEIMRNINVLTYNKYFQINNKKYYF